MLYRLVFDPVVTVKVATVSQMYPAQTFTLLNASGYVVAQRKASVASKATGRLEWLGVEEGSAVKKGQTIARLECEDAVAAREQAIANLNGAISNLEIAKAETDDAGRHYNRQRELHAQGIVARSEFDVAEARQKRGLRLRNLCGSRDSSRQGCITRRKGCLEIHLYSRPFRCGCVD